MEPIYIALDVETTGLDTDVDEIIEVAAVKFQGTTVLETFQRFVRPQYAVPLKITQFTHIDPADLDAAEPFAVVKPDLVRFVKTYPIVGHSVGFDLRMLAAQGVAFGQPRYDTFDLATLLLPNQSSYSLVAIAAFLGVPHPDAHRALADAETTRAVFVALLERIAALRDDQIQDIARLGNQIEWSLRPVFDAEAKRRAFGAMNSPLSSRLSAEPGVPWRHLLPLEPISKPEALDPEMVRAFFATGGLLNQVFPGYEPRTPQIDMTLAVAAAFTEEDTVLIEAPTGTGKSLAYLVPAAQWAANHGKRVVISTNTINLQDQLFGKDIPTLQHVVAHATIHSTGVEVQPFNAALLKGRSNYLCLRRYDQLRQSPTPTTDQAKALIKIGLWLSDTTTGDRAEVALQEGEQRTWNDVNVTLETCTGPRCPVFDRCFFYAARRTAEAAHLVIVNHALLVSDLKADGKVLPTYDHVVIDEAHHLEDVATDQLGWQVDQHALVRFLDGVWTAGGVRIVGGVLSELTNHFRGSGATPADADRAEGFAAALRSEVERARLAVYQLWTQLKTFVERTSRDNSYDLRVRLTPDQRKSAGWITVQGAWEQVMLPLAEIGRGLAKLEEHIRGLEDKELIDYDVLVLQLGGYANWAIDTALAGAALMYGDPDSIHWVAWDKQRDTLRLHQAPLHVGPLLHEKLFAHKAAVVLTSATLSIDHTFDYVKDRLGLNDAPIEEVQLESPFDYPRSTLLYLPTDMPEPNDKTYQETLENTLIELAKATGGRMLVLFTSNSALRQTYRAIQEPLELHDIVVLGQNIDGSRRSVLQRFKETPRAVLLGTSSFWEGVDVVGDALSVLVVAKLPFAVPNDPIFAARSDGFKDAFSEYAVPQSILKFKQGFGRLIRSKDDRGIVAVLDRRLLSKRYGQQFLGSLPQTTTQRGTLQGLPLAAARWLV